MNLIDTFTHPTFWAALLAVGGILIKDHLERISKRRESKRIAYETFIGKASPAMQMVSYDETVKAIAFYNGEGKGLMHMHASDAVLKQLHTLEKLLGRFGKDKDVTQAHVNSAFREVIAMCRKEIDKNTTLNKYHIPLAIMGMPERPVEIKQENVTQVEHITVTKTWITTEPAIKKMVDVELNAE